MIEVDKVTSSGAILYLKSSIGTTLLEVEAKNLKVCGLWAKGVTEAIADFTEEAKRNPLPVIRSKTKSAKAKYFAQKNIEMSIRKDAAEKKKAKILGGMKGGNGMKYSALVMANKAGE